MTSSPFFIVGCPRSGTTLLSQILDSHSRIAVCPETIYYPLFRPNLHRYGDLRRTRNVRRLIDDLVAMTRLQGLDPPTPYALQHELSAPTFEGVLTTFLRLYARDRGKARGGEKSATHHAYLPEILEKLPESPVIFLIRDPRDTVLSIRRMFHSGLDGAIHRWNEAFHSYRAAAESVHLVRYEELVTDPVGVVERVCASLGEAYEPELLRFFERVPEPLRTLPQHRKLLTPIDAGSVDQFRQLPAGDIARIESGCAVGMEAMGYPFTGARRRTAPSTAAKRPSRLELTVDRLRLYRSDPRSLRRGWVRWKMTMGVRVRYVVTLGPFRDTSPRR